MVQECTETTARVQLDSMPKTITVERVKLLVRNKDGSTSSAGGLEIRRLQPPAPTGGMTPAYGSQTPMHGSMTPRHDGGMTPSHTSRCVGFCMSTWRIDIYIDGRT